MNKTKAIGKLLSMIVAGTHALSVAHGSSAVAQTMDTAGAPRLSADDVMAIIENMNRDSPGAALRIEVAAVAGQSELVAAIAQGVRTCDPGSIQSCVQAAIERIGGLTTRNLVPLTDLSAALTAVGVADDVVSVALDAYSTAVVAAVTSGAVPEEYAAATLTGGTQDSLYL